MQVIEPQFQRDFISLLPKEVSSSLDPKICKRTLVLVAVRSRVSHFFKQPLPICLFVMDDNHQTKWSVMNILKQPCVVEQIKCLTLVLSGDRMEGVVGLKVRQSGATWWCQGWGYKLPHVCSRQDMASLFYFSLFVCSLIHQLHCYILIVLCLFSSTS